MTNQILFVALTLHNCQVLTATAKFVCETCSQFCQCVWVQDRFLNTHDADWATYVYNFVPRALAPKENPTCYNQLNNLSTKNIWSYSIVVHVQDHEPPVHEQTSWAGFQNKKRQT